MMDKRTYIMAVIIVFGLLLLSRMPALIGGGLDALTVVSSIVELVFLMWGILVFRK